MLKAVIKTMRPKQWIKNGFIFAALIFDRQLFIPNSFFRTFLGFVLFCMISGSVYIINDIMDVEADRNHPKKKNRPIASGALPVNTAIISAIILSILTISASFLLSTHFAWIVIVYFCLTLAYSLKLKHIPLIDVLVLASGYVLRVAAGVSLIQVERFSPWLYVVTTLLALYLGFGKRRGELISITNGTNTQRKVLDGYTIEFLDQLITIVSSTTIIAYSLYTFSAPNLPANHTMMLTIPFVLYGIFRYLYLLQVKKSGSAPEELVLTDRPLQITMLLFGISVILIFYILK